MNCTSGFVTTAKVTCVIHLCCRIGDKRLHERIFGRIQLFSLIYLIHHLFSCGIILEILQSHCPSVKRRVTETTGETGKEIGLSLLLRFVCYVLCLLDECCGIVKLLVRIVHFSGNVRL